MATFVSKNRRAVTGIAAISLAAGVLAGSLALTNPNVVAGFSANAAEVVTGQTPAVSVMVNSSESSAGVFAD
jgi:hypothetical protein